MTVREIYEASKDKPWAAKELDCLRGRFIYDGVCDSNPTCFVSIPDSLASSAMMRAMVEWLLTNSLSVAFWSNAGGTGVTIERQDVNAIYGGESRLHALLLACQSLHEQQKGKV